MVKISVAMNTQEPKHDPSSQPNPSGEVILNTTQIKPKRTRPPRPPEVKAAIAAALRGRSRPESTKRKISVAMLGKQNALGNHAKHHTPPIPHLHPPLGMRSAYPPHRVWGTLTLPMHPDSNPDNWTALVSRPQAAALREFLDLPTHPTRPELPLVEVSWDNHTFTLHGYLCIKDPNQTIDLVSHYVRMVKGTYRVINMDRMTFATDPPEANPLDAFVLLFENHIVGASRHPEGRPLEDDRQNNFSKSAK